MANLRNKNPIRVIIILAVLFITFAMGFLCSRISQVLMDFDSSGTADVARRVSSPDDSWTAILVRSYSFIDLNFALYITDDEMADITDPHGIAQFYLGNEPYVKDSPLWIRRALWISKDYDPSNFYNWHEDILWSNDSLVVAVMIEEQLVYAYDFSSGESFDNPEQIQSLLESHK